MAKRLKSVFTDDMEHCYFTGSPNCHRHHIFYGPYRKKSEEYGFVIPLAPHLHEFTPEGIYLYTGLSSSSVCCPDYVKENEDE